MLNFAIFAVICATLCNYCNCIVWEDCGSKQGKVSAVSVSGCSPAAKICDLKHGHNVTFTVNFVAKEDADKLTAVIHGVVAGIPVPFPMAHPDGCKDSGLACPLAKNKAYAYAKDMFVLKQYPKLRVIVKWELKDAKGADLFCIEVAAQVVGGETKPKGTKPKDTRLLFREQVRHLDLN